MRTVLLHRIPYSRNNDGEDNLETFVSARNIDD
jgi:hypothetical protein